MDLILQAKLQAAIGAATRQHLLNMRTRISAALSARVSVNDGAFFGVSSVLAQYANPRDFQHHASDLPPASLARFVCCCLLPAAAHQQSSCKPSAVMVGRGGHRAWARCARRGEYESGASGSMVYIKIDYLGSLICAIDRANF